MSSSSDNLSNLNISSGTAGSILRTLSSPIKPQRAKIAWNGEKVSITVFSNKHHNVYQKKFDGKAVDGFEDTFEFMVFFDVFTNTPG